MVQTDRTPKRVFVLGVYASAVHAKWIGPDGKLLVRALAVASEPYIFWRGEGAEDILRKIKIPKAAGRLEPAASNLNGPSGVTLDQEILAPLGLSRKDAWLCDLVPHTCLNPKQKVALEREYEPRREKLGLPIVNLPEVPKVFANAARRAEVLAELEESQAEVVIVLGDEPIRHWLRHLDGRWKKLSDFFGLQLERRVQDAIALRPEGHLPVGASLTVATGHPKIPYLVVAPTMVTPEMTTADASYRAMRAVLREVTRIPDLLHTLYCPGLATGVGAVPPHEAAAAMAEAYRDWLGSAGAG